MTPGRLVIAAAIIGAAIVVVYGLVLDRTGSSILLTVVGLAILGFAFAVLAIRLASTSVRVGWRGRAGESIAWALAGGVAALIASGTLGSALVLALLARPV